MKRIIIAILVLSLAFGCVIGLVGCGGSEQDEGVITIRNVYFGEWSAEQGDPYTEYIQTKFGIKLKTSNYNYVNWDTQVNGEVMGGRLPDVFQANVTSYNFDNLYNYWAEGEIIKPLPSDLSPWPYLKKMIESVKDIDLLKYKGKLYGIPVMRNISTTGQVSFAPFTYIYRRDVAKLAGVYQPNDEYTWEQFEALLEAFTSYFNTDNESIVLGDSEWGYPSVINFYKTAPHCFTENADGNIVNNYNTSEYLAGLAKAKEFVNKGYYSDVQADVSEKQNMIKAYYTQKKAGILYENLSFENYQEIRNTLMKDGKVSEADIDDYTAIMKIKGEDGKYALEGQEQWFSMTFLNYDISTAKMNKILDIMDWLLSEEGTMMALYGMEDVDYEIVTGNNFDSEYKGTKVKLLPTNLWEKVKGEYKDALNGAKSLRKMLTLGNDIAAIDPAIQKNAKKQHSYLILSDWTAEMQQAYEDGLLRVLTEPADVKWMQTKEKLANAGKLLDGANTAVLLYTFGKKNMSSYNSDMTSSTWNKVLNEINRNRNK